MKRLAFCFVALAIVLSSCATGPAPSPAMNGLIPNLEESGYGATRSFQTDEGKVILIWPRDLVELYESAQMQGERVYLYTRVGARSNDGTTILLIVDESGTLPPEELL